MKKKTLESLDKGEDTLKIRDLLKLDDYEKRKNDIYKKVSSIFGEYGAGKSENLALKANEMDSDEAE